ncbi:MAG: hypothetical protein JNM99_08165 [Verrucomicrobiaceae bacterium]|nr:hypothetical protein [Verrucomicrobiaceae bacterium]
MKHNSYLISILLLTIGLSSCYENAPDGRRAPPAEWSGVWIQTVTNPEPGSASYSQLEPVNDRIARLNTVSWNSTPGKETYSTSEAEVSVCEIDGQTVWCQRAVGPGTGDHIGLYTFAIAWKHNIQLVLLPALLPEAIKKNASPDELRGALAEFIRKQRAAASKDTTAFASSAGFSSYAPAISSKLPAPPEGLIDKARLRSAQTSQLPTQEAANELLRKPGKTGIKEIDDLGKPAEPNSPRPAKGIMGDLFAPQAKPTIKAWRDATADGGLRFWQGAMRSGDDMTAALALVAGSELVGYQMQAIKITLQNTAKTPAAVSASQLRVSSGEGGQSYTLIVLGWMVGATPSFNNSIQVNAQSEVEVFGYFTAPKGFQGTKLSID